MSKILLNTSRLILRPVRPGDADILHAMWILPSVRQYLWDNEEVPFEQVKEIIAQSISLFEEKGFGLWMIYERNTETVMGFCGLWHFFEEDLPQLLYGLHPDYIGQGYATEAGFAIREYAFSELNFPYLMASCDAPHVASQGVAQRLEMKFVREAIMEGKPTHFFRIDNPNYV